MGAIRNIKRSKQLRKSCKLEDKAEVSAFLCVGAVRYHQRNDLYCGNEAFINALMLNDTRLFFRMIFAGIYSDLPVN